jgi:hypothetical protein
MIPKFLKHLFSKKVTNKEEEKQSGATFMEKRRQ